MNNDYRYKLEKSSRKHFCPSCNKKRFVRYVDTKTGDYLPEQYGRCDRESKCSYHLNPYLDGYAKAIWEQEKGNRSELPNNWKPKRKKAIPQPEPEPIFFDFETFKQTLGNYDKNVFIQNLLCRVPFPFEADEVTKIIQLYRLGTVIKGSWTGAVTLPYIDKKGFVRTIQVKKFDEANHTTAQNKLDKVILSGLKKENRPIPDWLTKHIEYGDEYGYFTCLFGEHLLSKYPNNPVALVEAPKTAVYGTLYFGFPEAPEDFIWLAVYNKSSFSFDKLKALKGRFVYIFPDLSKEGNTFREWEVKAKEFESRLPGTRFILSDLLEQLAPEQDRQAGNDLADFLIKQDWRKYRKQEITEPAPEAEPEPEKVTEVTEVTLKTNTFFSNNSDFWSDMDELETNLVWEIAETKPVENLWKKKEQPKDWNNEIEELETYFAALQPSTEPVKLNSFSTITDCSLFIKSHLSTVKGNNGKETFLPYLERLQEFRKITTLIN